MDDANATVNYTKGYKFKFYKTEQLCFLSVIFALIVVGNAGVLANIITSQNRKSRMNFFLMQLAIADLTTGLLTVIPDIVWKSTIAWQGGVVGCKIVRYLQSVGIFSSVYVLVMLSIDRVDAIARPMNFTNSKRRSKMMVCCAWILALLLSSPLAFLSRVWRRHGVLQCVIDLPERWMWQVYITALAILLLILPAIVIAFCYSIIVISLWARRRGMAGETRTTSRTTNASLVHHQLENTNYNTHCSSVTNYASSQGIIPRARVKSIKMTFTIVLLFILCWCPFFIYNLLDVYGRIERTQEIIALSIFIQSLAPLNSAFNPVIYFIFSPVVCFKNRFSSTTTWSLSLNCSSCSTGQPRPLCHGNKLSCSANTSYTYQASSEHHQPLSFDRHSRMQIGDIRSEPRASYVRSTLSSSENAILLRHIQGSDTHNTNAKDRSRESSCTRDESVL